MTIKQFLFEIHRLQCNLMNINITIQVIKKENGFISIYVSVIRPNRTTKIIVTDRDSIKDIQDKYFLVTNALNLTD